MLQKYRLVFNAVILIAATFFFTPSQAIAAPACPEYMPNKYCNTFKTNCDRGKKPACNQLIRQKRAENKMKYVCKRSRGKHKYCNVLRHQKQRKLAMDRRSRSPRVARGCVVGNSCRIENQRCQNAYKNKKRIRGQFVCKSIRNVKQWTRVLPPRRTVAQNRPKVPKKSPDEIKCDDLDRRYRQREELLDRKTYTGSRSQLRELATIDFDIKDARKACEKIAKAEKIKKGKADREQAAADRRAVVTETLAGLEKRYGGPWARYLIKDNGGFKLCKKYLYLNRDVILKYESIEGLETSKKIDKYDFTEIDIVCAKKVFEKENPEGYAAWQAQVAQEEGDKRLAAAAKNQAKNEKLIQRHLDKNKCDGAGLLGGEFSDNFYLLQHSIRKPARSGTIGGATTLVKGFGWSDSIEHCDTSCDSKEEANKCKRDFCQATERGCLYPTHDGSRDLRFKGSIINVRNKPNKCRNSWKRKHMPKYCQQLLRVGDWIPGRKDEAVAESQSPCTNEEWKVYLEFEAQKDRIDKTNATGLGDSYTAGTEGNCMQGELAGLVGSAACDRAPEKLSGGGYMYTLPGNFRQCPDFGSRPGR